ncbi:hypothetical protein JOD43_001432 [Pullulanibacillus pueri]|uniref:hypothetical protein n=1 Tax=Pullulanibacillus pueri TaxID=1437324 RepID=UPI00195A468B|nr:hypothetical protein [Pullulanibacillus pueri]MBM7681265.1 hypothetical protein [Pullulanibacillus pueri]
MSEELLNRIFNEIQDMKQNMATKADLSNCATKDDLTNFATKDDLANFATKDDLANFATKDDLANFATKDDLANFATKEDVADIPYIKTAVNELSVKVSELSGRVDIIEKEMVRKADLQFIYHKIAEHDREIFNLKYQS